MIEAPTATILALKANALGARAARAATEREKRILLDNSNIKVEKVYMKQIENSELALMVKTGQCMK